LVAYKKRRYELVVFVRFGRGVSAQNSSGWKLLKSELESRGHQVICPDLPTGKPEASGMYYAEFVAAALRELPDAPIVVAHFGERLAFTSGREATTGCAHGFPGSSHS